MKKIDITYELEDFYHHLNEATIDRTIFSAKFGDGKTEFLKQFKEKYQDKYDFYTLYPVNYQIAPNEQIMEYIKRDLLFQLLLNEKIKPGIEIPNPIAFQWYLCNNTFDIIRDCMKFAPSLIGTMAQYQVVLEGVTALAETIIKQYQKFKDFKEEINNNSFQEGVNYIGRFNNEAGSIYELDPISWLIAKSITAEKRKTPILIIEDLDRIDPAHLFRILNIFSSHIDRKYLLSDQNIIEDDEEKSLDQLPNKFGFKKIIFIMDAEATAAIYEKFYGNYNYKGYISKFISKRIFEYSITKAAQTRLNEHFYHECGIGANTVFDALRNVRVNLDLSVRDIVRVLDDFTDSYRREEVIKKEVPFLSDTPVVRFIAILSRLGLNKQQIPKVIKEIPLNSMIISFLDCFALDENSIQAYNYLRYNGRTYQIGYTEDNGVLHLIDLNHINDENIKNIEYAEIDIDAAIAKALRYVN